MIIGGIVLQNNDWRHLVTAYRAVIPHPPQPPLHPPTGRQKLLELATSSAMPMYTIRAHPGKFWY